MNCPAPTALTIAIARPQVVARVTAGPVLLALAIGLAPALSGQNPLPRRPSLGPAADTNDAQAYYQLAIQRPGRSEAIDAYYWASRLEPNQPTYLFGRFHALLTRQPSRWQEAFWRGSRSELRSPRGQLIDSLRGEIMHRDPYAYVALPCPRLSSLGRDPNPERAGFTYWSVGCYQDATAALGRALERNPSRLELALIRAQGFYILREYDSTVASLNLVLDSLRARDEHQLVRTYESKAMFEFMIGLAHERRQDLTAAREAHGRALAEDLGMGVAHQRIGRIVKAQGDTAAALVEFGLAVDVRPTDAVLRFEYGTALLEAGRFADAETELRESARLEPWWPVPQFNLGAALQAQGKTGDAVTAYESYIALAPRRAQSRIQEARRRIVELRSRDPDQ
jgi:tetratricopeptide (TPR) repeat protein